MNSVLLDTGFLIRLLKQDEALHANARAYFEYFLQQQTTILCSTIAIAEYCVKGQVKELPLDYMRVLPFNAPHAVRAGKFAGLVFADREAKGATPRKIITNDTKLFAQAAVEGVNGFVTADIRAKKVYTFLRQQSQLGCDFIDLNTPLNEFLGHLPL